jgi:hypothetical protein
MSGGEAVEVLILMVIFLGGVTGGALAIVSAAIKREDKERSITQSAPDPAARGTRVLTGVGSRDCGPPERRS